MPDISTQKATNVSSFLDMLSNYSIQADTHTLMYTHTVPRADATHTIVYFDFSLNIISGSSLHISTYMSVQLLHSFNCTMFHYIDHHSLGE